MIVKMKIECEDLEELKSHLTKIRQGINKIPKEYDMSKPLSKVVLKDNNCYGMHRVVIRED